MIGQFSIECRKLLFILVAFYATSVICLQNFRHARGKTRGNLACVQPLNSPQEKKIFFGEEQAAVHRLEAKSVVCL